MSEPTITFGVQDGWSLETTSKAPQNNDSTVTSERANALGPTGNEVAAHLHSEKTEVSTNYKAATTGAVTVPPAIGALVNGLILTGISIQTTADDYATMTLTGHNHSTNPHADNPALKTGTHGVTLAAGFGCTDFLAGTAGSNASAVSSGVNIACEHKDEDAGSGEHLVGDNFHGSIEGNTEWVGVPGSNASEAWDVTSAATRTDNQNFLRTSIQAVKALALA